MRPTIIAVGGFNSNTGKTTLVCELLRALPGWEALKMTRGHYRSCGKDPHACCVSHLLGDAPVIRSGSAQTYAPGKDTGRYWDAGASDVHWAVMADGQVEAVYRAALARVKGPGVVVEGNSFLRSADADFAVLVARADVHWAVMTVGQVEAGFRAALARVKGPGVVVEGNSILRSAYADFAVLVARADVLKIKPSARRALPKASALYLSDAGTGLEPSQLERFEEWWRDSGLEEAAPALPRYTRESLPQLVARVEAAHALAV